MLGLKLNHVSKRGYMPVSHVHLLSLEYIPTLMQDTLNSHVNWTLKYLSLSLLIDIDTLKEILLMWQELTMAIW